MDKTGMDLIISNLMLLYQFKTMKSMAPALGVTPSHLMNLKLGKIGYILREVFRGVEKESWKLAEEERMRLKERFLNPKEGRRPFEEYSRNLLELYGALNRAIGRKEAMLNENL